MTSLSDKVARVKGTLVFHPEVYKEIITQLWEELGRAHIDSDVWQQASIERDAIIQKQREVLGMAREALGTCKSGVGFFSDQFWFDDDFVPDAITAIDNVMMVGW